METPKKCIVCRHRIPIGDDVCELCKLESSPEFLTYMRELENKHDG